jgi:thiamine biosynthesis lipoprotein
VGAIAKGYVADRVLAYAREKGVDSLLFDIGGHVLAIGHKPDGRPWTVQVRNPRDGGAYTTLEVTDASVVTSGNDQRYFEVDGVRYHHLIDPETLYPATFHSATTVVVPLAYTAQADGLSTATFLMSRDAGETLLKAYDGVEAIWIP